MRISDWSSDVCSSDLTMHRATDAHAWHKMETMNTQQLKKTGSAFHHALESIILGGERCSRWSFVYVCCCCSKGVLLENRKPAKQHLVDRKSTRLNSSH